MWPLVWVCNVCLRPFHGFLYKNGLDWKLFGGTNHVNSADIVQMQQNVVSDQGLHCLPTGISAQNTIKVKTAPVSP